MTHNHGAHQGEEHECACGGNCAEDEGYAMTDVKNAAVVESAHALSEKEKIKMTELVSHVAGRSMAVEFKVNPKLLGGFTVQLGDRKLDASIRSELTQMKNALKGNSNG